MIKPINNILHSGRNTVRVCIVPIVGIKNSIVKVDSGLIDVVGKVLIDPAVPAKQVEKVEQHFGMDCKITYINAKNRGVRGMYVFDYMFQLREDGESYWVGV